MADLETILGRPIAALGPALKDKPTAGVAVYPSGVSAFRFYGPSRGRGPGAVRGEIKGFSPASRRRLRRRLLRYDWGKLAGARRALWCTFSARQGTAADFKRWLDTLRKRLQRRVPRAWLVWRLEYQARGVAHVHCLVVLPSQAVALALIEWLVFNWCEICGVLDGWDGEDNAPNAMPVAQCVRVVKGVYSVASYISDASKVSQAVPPEGEHPGRWWGLRGVAEREERQPCVVVRGIEFIYQMRRFVGDLRRARYRTLEREWWWRGPPRDCVEFLDTGSLFRVTSVFTDQGEFTGWTNYWRGQEWARRMARR